MPEGSAGQHTAVCEVLYAWVSRCAYCVLLPRLAANAAPVDT